MNSSILYCCCPLKCLVAQLNTTLQCKELSLMFCANISFRLFNMKPLWLDKKNVYTFLAFVLVKSQATVAILFVNFKDRLLPDRVNSSADQEPGSMASYPSHWSIRGSILSYLQGIATMITCQNQSQYPTIPWSTISSVLVEWPEWMGDWAFMSWHSYIGIFLSCPASFLHHFKCQPVINFNARSRNTWINFAQLWPLDLHWSNWTVGHFFNESTFSTPWSLVTSQLWPLYEGLQQVFWGIRMQSHRVLRPSYYLSNKSPNKKTLHLMIYKICSCKQQCNHCISTT